MIRVLFICLALISHGFSQSNDSVFTISEAPEAGVYDPLDWLEAKKRMELEESYHQAREKWGVRIFVVILPERPALGIEVFSKKIGRDWGGGDTWGVLLHVVDDAESPWCVAERGDNLRWTKQEEFDRALEGAMSRAHREAEPDLSVMVGARELTDELGFLGIVSNRRDQMLGKAREEKMQRDGAKITRQRLVERFWMIGTPIVILGFVAFFFLRSRFRDRREGFEFPETAPRARFHGPWSGGGNVLVDFSGKNSGEETGRG